MSRLVESPTAPEFPSSSEKIDLVLESVSIRLFADTVIAKIQKEYRVRSTPVPSYVSPNNYSFSRDFEKLVEATIRSQNSIFVAQLIRVVYAMDTFPVEPYFLDSWQSERATVDIILDEFLNSELWIKYVNFFDKHDTYSIPGNFSSYHEEAKTFREFQFKQQAQTKKEVFFTPTETRAQHSIFSLEMQKYVAAVIKTSDTEQVLEVLNIFADSQESNYADSEYYNYQARHNIQALLERLRELNTDAFQTFVSTHTSAGNIIPNSFSFYLQIAEASMENNLLKLWELVQVALEQDGVYEYHVVTLLSALVKNRHPINEEERQTIARFIYSQSSLLLKTKVAELLGAFPNLTDSEKSLSLILEIIAEDFYNKKGFNFEKITPIVQNFLQYGRGEEKAVLLHELRTHLTEALSKRGLPEEELDDDDKSQKIYFSEDEVALSTDVAIALNDQELLQMIVQYGKSQFTSHTVGADRARRGMLKATEFLVRNGSEDVIDDLVHDAVDAYNNLENLGLLSYVKSWEVDLEFLTNPIPLMLTVFTTLLTKDPTRKIEVLEGNETGHLMLSKVVENIVEFFEWISKGVDVLYEPMLGFDYHLSNDISSTLDVGRHVLDKVKDTQVQRVVRMALISEAKRRLNRIGYHDLTTALFYLESSFADKPIKSKPLTESDIISVANKEHLRWIIDLLMPPAQLSSDHQNAN